MITERDDFRTRIAGLLGLRGVVLTEPELLRMTERYPRCSGRDQWDVREYARHARPGAREYRVIRGSGVQDVYASVDRERATAVGTALNLLEAQDAAGND